MPKVDLPPTPRSFDSVEQIRAILAIQHQHAEVINAIADQLDALAKRVAALEQPKPARSKAA